MRRIFLFFVFFVTACQSVSTGTSVSPILTVTATRTATLAPSATPLATETPAPPTVTPLPTIPTFTPTFDVRTIVTATPGPRAECPAIQENAAIDLSNFDDYYPDILTALNHGAPINRIIDVFEKEIGEHFSLGFSVNIEYEMRDVTSDSVPEIILPGSAAWDQNVAIFGCVAGKYEKLFSWHYQMKYLSLEVSDANRNGIPEIFIGDDVCSATGCSFEMSVVEWHQDAFQLIQNDIDGGDAASWGVEIADIDKDNLKEIFWRGGIPMYSVVTPWRLETHIYKWNGSKFVALPVGYSPPQYRFQAIQDADQKVNNHEYDQAFSLYQDAIFNDKLDWWSSEKQFYNLEINPIHYEGIDPTPTRPPLPNEDKTEYPRLAAYAYYRMIILHIHLGQMDAAQLKYATLQGKFLAGSPGHPYVEMATAFWDAYQSSQKMYNACGAAIAYADAHPEILIPLGSDYHGWQSHTYTPADVCPFR